MKIQVRVTDPNPNPSPSPSPDPKPSQVTWALVWALVLAPILFKWALHVYTKVRCQSRLCGSAYYGSGSTDQAWLYTGMAI